MSLSKCKISIVTPSFNQGDFLEESIQSVIHQKDVEIEYVVIDGGSQDESVEIIKRNENKGQGVSYWVSESDGSHGQALNKGFAQTTGEIMAGINSDDKYMAGSLSIVHDIFESFPHVMWITGMSGFWDAKGRLVDVFSSYKNSMDFLSGNPKWIQQESTFWRRSLWNAAGGKINENYKYMIDCELGSRFFKHAELYHVNTVLSGYRWHTTNRAHLFSSQCDGEIQRILHDMREHADLADTRRLHLRTKMLQRYSRLNAMGRMGRCFASRLRAKNPELFASHYIFIRNEMDKGNWVLEQISR
jgi:glycosyltransferase involved in cell wall biosynthesis